MGIKDPVLIVTGALVNPRTNFRPGPLGSGDESSRIWITSVLPTIRESINDHKGRATDSARASLARPQDASRRHGARGW